jgi:radical SAM protein with 4Fe4S-binding SPASM domain
MKKTTFALFFGNRGFFPGELIADARRDLVAACEAAGYETLVMDEELTRYGAVETIGEGRLFANFLEEHRGEFDGVILSLPNFGDENGAVVALRDAGVPMLTFTGGEPTQRADLAELVAHARWFITRLNTNGVNLTKELTENLKKADLDSVQITLYSSSEAVHNALVGSTHFSDTVQGIENAVSAGLDVSVNTPLCRKNADYSETLRFLYEKGVRFVTVSGLICTGTAGVNHGEYDLSREELTEIVKQAKKFCNTHEMEIDFTSPGLIDEAVLESIGMNVPMCGAALSNMAVAPDGTVVPCQSWLGSDAELGNILTDSFKSIWKHKSCKKLRKMTREEALSCPFRRTSGKEATDGIEKA